MIACLANVESLALVYSTRNLPIKVLSWQLHGRHFVDQILSVTILVPLVPGTKCWDKPKHRSSKTVGSNENIFCRRLILSMASLRSVAVLPNKAVCRSRKNVGSCMSCKSGEAEDGLPQFLLEAPKSISNMATSSRGHGIAGIYSSIDVANMQGSMGQESHWHVLVLCMAKWHWVATLQTSSVCRQPGLHLIKSSALSKNGLAQQKDL